VRPERAAIESTERINSIQLRCALRPPTMSSPSASPSSPPPASRPPRPTHLDLFLAFVRITLSGFGGTLPWTRRMFVEQKKWMTAEEFNEAYALCQFLPGPNIVNLTTIFGSRMHGATGALACWCGFLLLPFTFMVVLGALYREFGDLDALRRVLAGIAAAAAGLLIATVAKMAAPLFRKLTPAPLPFVAIAIAIGVMRWPLLAVMAALVPFSIALSWWWGRR
jgi:chromate transporter